MVLLCVFRDDRVDPSDMMCHSSVDAIHVRISTANASVHHAIQHPAIALRVSASQRPTTVILTGICPTILPPGTQLLGTHSTLLVGLATGALTA